MQKMECVLLGYQIAQVLDDIERKFMQESGVESEDYVKYLAEGSGNVSTDGFFSIQVNWPACLSMTCRLIGTSSLSRGHPQVLSSALDVFGLSCQNLDGSDCVESAAHPEKENAFICNLRVSKHYGPDYACMDQSPVKKLPLAMRPGAGWHHSCHTTIHGAAQEHWFALRRVAGDWWDLNSLFAAPRPLSEFYLSAYLATLRDQGYSIFVVQGQLPGPFPDPVAAQQAPGAWFTPEQASLCAVQGVGSADAPGCLGWVGPKFYFGNAGVATGQGSQRGCHKRQATRLPEGRQQGRHGQRLRGAPEIACLPPPTSASLQGPLHSHSCCWAHADRDHRDPEAQGLGQQCSNMGDWGYRRGRGPQQSHRCQPGAAWCAHILLLVACSIWQHLAAEHAVMFTLDGKRSRSCCRRRQYWH